MVRCLWLLFFLSTIAFSSPERTLWYSSESAWGPVPTEMDRARSQVSVSSENFQDAIASGASGLVDLRFLEISAAAYRRTFLGISQSTELSSEAQVDTYGFEVARYYAGPRGVFGRFGIGYFGEGNFGIHEMIFHLTTGYLSTSQSDWRLQIDFSYSLRKPAEVGNLMHLRIHGGRDFAAKNRYYWNLGGVVGWDNRMRDFSDPAKITRLQDYEYMLFTLGPALTWEGPLGHFEGVLGVRHWLDVRLIQIASPNQWVNSSTFDVAGSLRWTLVF